MANWYSGVLKYVDDPVILAIILTILTLQYRKTEIWTPCAERRSSTTMASVEEGTNISEPR